VTDADRELARREAAIPDAEFRSRVASGRIKITCGMSRSKVAEVRRWLREKEENIRLNRLRRLVGVRPPHVLREARSRQTRQTVARRARTNSARAPTVGSDSDDPPDPPSPAHNRVARGVPL
jgi:hypothetical protein